MIAKKRVGDDATPDMPWRRSAHCGCTAVGGGWWTGSTTTVATVAAAEAAGVTVAIPLPSSPIFAPSAVPSVTLPPPGTWSVDRLATMEETAMKETAMAAAAGGGSDPLLPLPPWATPIFMFMFIPPPL